MKTSSTITRIFQLTFAAFAFVTSLMITSCQKEEMQQSSLALNSEEHSDVERMAHSTRMAFKSINFNHLAAKSMKADYSVTLYANGYGVFEGRRNVFCLKRINFKISTERLMFINNICRSVDLFDLNRIKNNTTPDMPSIITTYSKNDQTLSLTEYEGKPALLNAFRTKIEMALDLSRFIDKPVRVTSASANAETEW